MKLFWKIFYTLPFFPVKITKVSAAGVVDRQNKSVDNIMKDYEIEVKKFMVKIEAYREFLNKYINNKDRNFCYLKPFTICNMNHYSKILDDFYNFSKKKEGIQYYYFKDIFTSDKIFIFSKNPLTKEQKIICSVLEETWKIFEEINALCKIISNIWSDRKILKNSLAKRDNSKRFDTITILYGEIKRIANDLAPVFIKLHNSFAKVYDIANNFICEWNKLGEKCQKFLLCGSYEGKMEGFESLFTEKLFDKIVEELDTTKRKFLEDYATFEKGNITNDFLIEVFSS